MTFEAERISPEKLRKYHQTPSGIMALKAARINANAARALVPGKIYSSDLWKLWLSQMGLDIQQVHCAICGRLSGYSVDHIIEIADGGHNIAENIQMVCEDCHVAKTTRSRHARKEAAMRPRKFAAIQRLNKVPSGDYKKPVKPIRVLKRQTVRVQK